MELILINDSKIKIMLTASDMEQYAIHPNILESEEDRIRSAFREIFDEARNRTGFDTNGMRLYIQFFPSREGGCELFVTKLGRQSPAGGSGGETASPLYGGVRDREISKFSPESLQSGNGRKRTAAYSFESLNILLSVCKRLHSVPHGGDSSAYQGEDGTFYLFLYGMEGISARNQLDPYFFLTEYGSPENADSLLLYIQEHAKPICESDAVRTLATF